MRHGEAQNPFGHSLSCDSERELTPQGNFDAQLMADWLTKNNVTVAHFWVSPFIRAQQTAGIISKNIKAAFETLTYITPAGDAKQVHDYIDTFIADQLSKSKESTANDDTDNEANNKNLQALFIVSHMPLVSYLVAELTQYQAAPIFATAAIAQIDYDPKSMKGVLVRLISPLELTQ